jgi:hypothetical protein
MHRVLVVAVLLLFTCRAFAEDPPPNPAAGESYDGRPHGPSWREDLVLVPRLMLAPVEWLFKLGLGWPFHRLLDWDEEHHVHETILAAFSSPDGLIGVRPAFQYALGYRPVVGLRLFDRKLMGRDSDFQVTGMTGGTDIVYGEVYARPTRGNRAVAVAVRTIYNRRDDQVFTAVGYADTDPTRWTLPTRYAVDAFDGGGELTLAAAPGVTFAGTAAFGLRRFGNGVRVGVDPPIADVYCVRDLTGRCIPGTVDEWQVPGFNRGTQFARLGASFRLDSRDNWYQPASGALLDLGCDWSHGLGFDHSQYVRLHGALVAVLDLWQRSRTLLAKVATEMLLPIGPYPIPFSELIVLGGPDDFRGFRPGRFRNESSLLLALEYRWPIWMWMDASLFAEYGGVFGRDFIGFGLGRMRPDVGAGVRLRSSSDFYVRAQVAYGWGDGLQLFLSFNAGL